MSRLAVSFCTYSLTHADRNFVGLIAGNVLRAFVVVELVGSQSARNDIPSQRTRLDGRTYMKFVWTPAQSGVVLLDKEPAHLILPNLRSLASGSGRRGRSRWRWSKGLTGRGVGRPVVVLRRVVSIVVGIAIDGLRCHVGSHGEGGLGCKRGCLRLESVFYQ